MQVQTELRDVVYWIGGGTCAGKSTVANILSTKHGLTPYHADDHWGDHVERADPTTQPFLHRLGSMGPGDWFLRPHDKGIADELAGLQEEVGPALEDLQRLGTNSELVAEGTLFLPDRLKLLGIPKDKAIWLIPTSDFRRSEYWQRGWVNDVLRHYEDSDAAWETWMRRDALIADRIRDSAANAGYTSVQVDGSETVEQVAQRVEAHFFTG